MQRFSVHCPCGGTAESHLKPDPRGMVVLREAAVTEIERSGRAALVEEIASYLEERRRPETAKEVRKRFLAPGVDPEQGGA